MRQKPFAAHPVNPAQTGHSPSPALPSHAVSSTSSISLQVLWRRQCSSSVAWRDRATFASVTWLQVAAPVFQLHTIPRRYCAHPKYLMYSKYAPLRTCSSHHTLHFLPARSLITMFHPQTTQMKLPLLLVLVLYSVTKGNILTQGTKPVALLLMCYDKELNPSVAWKQGTKITAPKKALLSHSLFLIFFF